MNAVVAVVRPSLPTMLRSHKYGGRLMTQQEFRDREALSKAVGRFIGLAAHDAMSHSMHLRNRLHVDHNVHCLDEIPADRLADAIDFVRSVIAKAESAAATGERKAWRPIREMLKKDTPWIPWITRKYRERYGKEVGANPDWRALYAELNGNTIWRNRNMLDTSASNELHPEAESAYVEYLAKAKVRPFFTDPNYSGEDQTMIADLKLDSVQAIVQLAMDRISDWNSHPPQPKEVHRIIAALTETYRILNDVRACPIFASIL